MPGKINKKFRLTLLSFTGQVYTLRSFQKEWKGVECKCKLTKKLKTSKNNGGKIVQILRYWG